MSKEEFEMALCVYESEFNWTFHTDDPDVWNPNEEEIHPVNGESTTYRYLTPWVEYPIENLRILKQRVKLLESLGVNEVSTYWDDETRDLAVWGYDESGLPIKTWWSPDFHAYSGFKEYSR